MGTTVQSTTTPHAILVGRVTSSIAALAFALALLASLAFGARLGTALIRALVVAAAAMLAVPLLAWPVVGAVLDAATRDVGHEETDS